MYALKHFKPLQVVTSLTVKRSAEAWTLFGLFYCPLLMHGEVTRGPRESSPGAANVRLAAAGLLETLSVPQVRDFINKRAARAHRRPRTD
ncbi:hypothetical protein EVAR_6724_1 [Eumeta japonica]|uniref:Uncharacterized protein n=1 Tax=Eumeta variegata TaxID=151549 RepID=A0A4C1V4T2_EUMVA|nr:hypothetical protein EVAR_6724_1 [Eumeta japonica]